MVLVLMTQFKNLVQVVPGALSLTELLVTQANELLFRLCEGGQGFP